MKRTKKTTSGMKCHLLFLFFSPIFLVFVVRRRYRRFTRCAEALDRCGWIGLVPVSQPTTMKTNLCETETGGLIYNVLALTEYISLFLWLSLSIPQPNGYKLYNPQANKRMHTQALRNATLKTMKNIHNIHFE